MDEDLVWAGKRTIVLPMAIRNCIIASFQTLSINGFPDTDAENFHL